MPILTPEERVGSTMAEKYRLERIVASGGMATVFAGMHAWTERAVAVKILNYEHARDPEVVRRFLQEARAAAQLKHPNVVDVLDMGQDVDGTVYLVLELLEGETLKARMRRGRLSSGEIGSLLLPVMRAVASAHLKSVVHRDLKPDNVFLANEGDGKIVPKLLDFGIAKVSRDDSSSTRTGMMVGTPQYMSPEQVRGDRAVGPAADVWSMGVVLHAALCGRVPFEGDSTAVVLARVLTERARPLLSIEPNAPSALAAVVDRALQYEASARFSDMNEMIAALEAALAHRTTVPSLRPASSPGELTASPTPRPAMRSVPPPRISEPPVTPFSWTSAPTGAPASPTSRLPLIGLVAFVTIFVVGAALAFMGRAGPTHTAAPVITSTPLPPAPIVRTLPVLPPPVIAAPEPDPVAPPVAPPAAPLPVEAAVAAPDPVVLVPEEMVPAERASPPAESAPREETATTEPRATPRATESAPREERSPREPRRGTRGALILH